jgi:hypothetical protein
VLTQRYKLANGKELYDLEKDPAETKDIASEEPSMVRQLRTSYEAWFEDVGKQGYDPPKIVLTKRAPTLLTRQDWRGEGASWDANGIGHWEVQAAYAGPYKVTVLFEAAATARTLEATWLGKHEIAAGQKKLELKAVKLPVGVARFEAKLGSGSESRGIHYAYFEP